MHLHFLGTASGLPTAQRASQTIALETDAGDLVLLDVADGASHLLLRQGLDHARVTDLVISHMHGDHHSGLTQFLKTAMHHKRTAPLRLFAPSEGLEALQAYLRASYLVPEWLGYEIQWTAIQAEQALAAGGRLLAEGNEHLARVRRRAAALAEVPAAWAYQSYSFVLEVGGLRLVYAGNLDLRASEIDAMAADADLVIMELAHLRHDTLAEDIARWRGPVLLTHLHPSYDGERQDELLQWLAGQTKAVLTQDGMRYPLPSTASGTAG